MHKNKFFTLKSDNKQKEIEYIKYTNEAIEFIRHHNIKLIKNFQINFTKTFIQTLNSYYKNERKLSNACTVVPFFQRYELYEHIYKLLSKEQINLIIINSSDLKGSLPYTATIVHELIHHTDFAKLELTPFNVNPYLFILFSEYRAKYYQELYHFTNTKLQLKLNYPVLTSYNSSFQIFKTTFNNIEHNIKKDKIFNLFYNAFHSVGTLLALSKIYKNNDLIFFNTLKNDFEDSLKQLNKVTFSPDDLEKKYYYFEEAKNILNKLIHLNELQEIDFIK